MRFANKIFLLSMVPIIVFAQIPNAGFENWTEGNPDGWTTNNIIGAVTPITQSADAHSGSSAAKLEVVSFSIPYGALLFSSSAEQTFFPISQNYMSVRGYYKFHKENPLDNVFAQLSIYATDSVSLIAVGGLEIIQAQTAYTSFEIPVEYIYPALEAGYMYLSFINFTADSLLTVGSYLLLDDLSLSMVTGIDKDLSALPKQFSLGQNYPNPFNPSTTINYQLAMNSVIDLSIYNLLGQKVATLVSLEQAAGSYNVQWDASNFSSGVYLYRLETDQGFMQTKRLILLK